MCTPLPLFVLPILLLNIAENTASPPSPPGGGGTALVELNQNLVHLQNVLHIYLINSIPLCSLPLLNRITCQINSQ